MLFRILVVAILLVIFASLTSALVFLFGGQGQETRMVRALTWRVGLSLLLFLLLLAGFLTGMIPPGGIASPP
jgi:hypothetical protein